MKSKDDMVWTHELDKKLRAAIERWKLADGEKAPHHYWGMIASTVGGVTKTQCLNRWVYLKLLAKRGEEPKYRKIHEAAPKPEPAKESKTRREWKWAAPTDVVHRLERIEHLLLALAGEWGVKTPRLASTGNGSAIPSEEASTSAE